MEGQYEETVGEVTDEEEQDKSSNITISERKMKEAGHKLSDFM